MSDAAVPSHDDHQSPIALALSGGGFHSAAFHLGVLTTLHRVDLLDRVQAVGSTSGGALVASRWILGVVRGQTFDEIWFALSTYLKEHRPLAAARERAVRTGIRSTQALSRELEEHLLADSRHPQPTLRELFDTRLGPPEASFDAANVRSGEAFRFAVSRGSDSLPLPRPIAEHMLISDVIAATCAVPGETEAMWMPQDFHWPDDRVADSADEATGGSVPLLAGDLLDAASLESLASVAGRLPDGVGLHIVSDATGDPPQLELKDNPRGFGLPWIRMRQLGWISWLLFAGGIASLYLLWQKVQAERAIHDFRWPTDFIAFGVPMLFVVVTMCALIVSWGWMRSAGARLLADHNGVVPNLRTARVVKFLSDRDRALRAIAQGGIQRRMRALVQRTLSTEGAFEGRVIVASLASITAERAKMVDGLYAPGESVLAAARRARSHPDRFEIASRAEFADLTLSGQAAAIFALVEMLERQHGIARDAWPETARALDERLRSDWNALNLGGEALRPEAPRGSVGRGA